MLSQSYYAVTAIACTSNVSKYRTQILDQLDRSQILVLNFKLALISSDMNSIRSWSVIHLLPISCERWRICFECLFLLC